MRIPDVARHPQPFRGAVSRWTLMLAMVSLAACATHHGDPPRCKGTFTPINQPASVVANGSQR